MTTRNSLIRRRRAEGWSQRRIAREFHISRARVTHILDRTGGDPINDRHDDKLRAASIDDIRTEIRRLRDRIAADRRRLRVLQDELEVRNTDRVLGLTS